MHSYSGSKLTRLRRSVKYTATCSNATASIVSIDFNETRHVVTFAVSDRKKCVDVVLAGSEINKIKYEMTLLDETRRSRKRSKFNFNFTIRNLRRIDFDLIPSVRPD